MNQASPVDGPEIELERHADIAVVRFNRPQQRNPISLTLGRHLLGILDELDGDDNVRAVVLSGAGSVFCAGGKMGEVLGTLTVSPRAQYRAFADIVRAVGRLRTMELPVICALNGPAIGGGAALALACDLIVASEQASLSFAFGRVGASAADMGCAYLLPRMVGTVRARHLLLTGAEVTARQCREYGLIFDVVAHGDLIESALALARSVASSAPRQALAATKAVLMRGETTDFDTCLFYELYLQSYFLSGDDHKQRVAALRRTKGRGPPAP